MKNTRTKKQALALLILSLVIATYSLAIGQGLPYDKNYTTTKTARVSGITTLADLNSRPVSQVNTSISYTDGFGRPLQGIAVGASPSEKDIIQPYGYDAVGRQAKSYLPYTKTTANGLMDEEALIKNSTYTQSSQYTFYNGSTATIEADAKPYSENIYTNNRITETYGPGAAWTTGKSVKSVTKLNNASEVRFWQIEEGAPISYSYWPENSIVISELTDEQGIVSYEYVDQRGLTMLRSSGGVNTYYVYSGVGNLRFILTPESVTDLPDLPTGSSADYVSGNFETSSYQSKSYVYGLNGSVTLKPGFSINASTQGNFSVTAGAPQQGIIDDYVFQYEYDDYNRLIKEKSPGADWVYYVYDQWDRLVMSQDGKQRAENVNKWSFTKYDFYNRPIMSGVTTLSGTNTHTSLQAAAMASSGRYESANGSLISYTLTNSYPSIGSNDVLTVTHYDNYDFKINMGVIAADYNPYTPSGFTVTQAPSVKGLITGSKTRLLGTTSFLHTVVYYDKENRPIQTVTSNHLGGTDRQTNQYDFTGNVLKSLTEHDAPDYSSSLDILEEYTYDHVGRLVDTYQTIGSGTRTLLSSLVYNELGQVIENNVHSTDNGSSFLQSVDYRYNIRGWLTSINNSELANDGGTTNNDTNDLFGMQMAYNETPVQVNGANTQQFYNGNISSLRWKSDIQKGTPVERAFGYEYDNRYQLDKAKFGAKSGTGVFNNENGYYNVDNLTYDNNGNIKTLKREGYWGSKTTIDNLTYGYDGNKVKNVEDSGNEAGFNNEVVGLATEYGYDENGNMEYDLNKTIVEIRYNELGLVDYVEFESGVNVLSTYDAAGILLGKEVKEGTTTKYTADYVNGLVYENGDISFLHTAQGRAIPTSGSNWEYEYYYTDHLGNIRLVYGYFKETDVYKATLEPGKAADETAFGNMGTAQANQPNHTLSDASDPAPNYSAKLNPYSSGPAVGPALMVPVTAGDVVNMETWARYNVTTGGVNSLVSNLASLVSSAFNGVSGVSEANRTTLSNAVPGVSGNIPNGGGNNEPKAYLNYILFDNSYAQSQFGYVAVSDDGYQTYERLTTGDLTMPVSGYLYIYVANESTANVDVWFDDLKIIHQKANNQLQVVGAKDYYPFGLQIAGTEYWNEARKSYKYGYQGIYSEQDSLTKWNTFALRSYDPALGRFISIDPAGQFASPYLGMANNPSNYTDPSGAVAGAIAHSIFGAAMIGAHNAHQTGGDPWAGAAQGALYGAISYASGGLSSQLGSHVGSGFLSSVATIGSNTLLGAGSSAALGGGISWDGIGLSAAGNTVSERYYAHRKKVVQEAHAKFVKNAKRYLPSVTLNEVVVTTGANYLVTRGGSHSYNFETMDWDPTHGDYDYWSLRAVNGIVASVQDAINQAGQVLNTVAWTLAPLPKLGLLGRVFKTTKGGTTAAKASTNAIKIAEGGIPRIQNAANRIGRPIHLVGSRASGTARATSDFDYVIEGINSKQWSKIKNSLPGAPSRIDNLPRRIDLFRGLLDPTKPHITIYPH